MHVCTQCDYHFRISADERFKIFFDNASYEMIDTKKTSRRP